MQGAKAGCAASISAAGALSQCGALHFGRHSREMQFLLPTVVQCGKHSADMSQTVQKLPNDIFSCYKFMKNAIFINFAAA